MDTWLLFHTPDLEKNTSRKKKHFIHCFSESSSWRCIKQLDNHLSPSDAVYFLSQSTHCYQEEEHLDQLEHFWRFNFKISAQRTLWITTSRVSEMDFPFPQQSWMYYFFFFMTEHFQVKVNSDKNGRVSSVSPVSFLLFRFFFLTVSLLTFNVMSSEQEANRFPVGSHLIAFTSFCREGEKRDDVYNTFCVFTWSSV